MITPQMNRERTDHEVEVPPAAASVPTAPVEAMTTPVAREPTAAERPGPELAWASLILLGTLILLVAIGLWIAVAANISIAAVLLGVALLVLVIAALANVLDDAMLRPQ